MEVFDSLELVDVFRRLPVGFVTDPFNQVLKSSPISWNRIPPQRAILVRRPPRLVVVEKFIVQSMGLRQLGQVERRGIHCGF